MEAVRGERTIAEIAQKHDLHPNQVTEWRRPWLERAVDGLDGGGRSTAPAVDRKALHAKIRQWARGMILWKARSARRDC